jgi:anti-sigma28 factor (negative regulator of flagellin synthesis)
MTSIHRSGAPHAARLCAQNTALRTRRQTAGSVSLSGNARQQKLAAVKQQLSDGTYQVSLQTLARNMLASSDAHN